MDSLSLRERVGVRGSFDPSQKDPLILSFSLREKGPDRIR
jgi:hypothetical protein